MRIAVCAPGTALWQADADQVAAMAAVAFPEVELIFDSQCFASCGHFAGDDATRADTLVRLANDPAIDAIWFARGGYGACRIAETVISQLNSSAGDKVYCGYSDAGNLLGALYRHRIGRVVHGPMPTDIKRLGGDATIARALGWLARRDQDALADEVLDETRPVAAFNLVTLAMMAGTPLMPDLANHVVMVEEVSEHLYAFDRAFFHLGSHLADVGVAGLRLGRVSEIPSNDRPFGETPEEVARRWCERFGIAWLGHADIGHDSANKCVPFGFVSDWVGS